MKCFKEWWGDVAGMEEASQESYINCHPASKPLEAVKQHLFLHTGRSQGPGMGFITTPGVCSYHARIWGLELCEVLRAPSGGKVANCIYDSCILPGSAMHVGPPAVNKQS